MIKSKKRRSLPRRKSHFKKKIRVSKTSFASATPRKKRILLPQTILSTAVDTAPFANLQLAAAGTVQVLVVLDKSIGLSVKDVGKELGKNFAAPRTSHVAALALSQGKKVPQPFRIFERLGVVLGTVDSEGFRKLRQEASEKGSLVASVEVAPVLRLVRPVKVLAAAQPQDALTWGLQMLQVDHLWAQGIKGQGVTVAHLDTGVDGTHPVLQGAIASFAQFDYLGNLVSPSPAPFDSGEHGTHTAATVAGRAVNGKSVGVAPDAQLASAMIIEGGDVQARVLGGLEWALEQQAKVLTMSLGFPGWMPSFISVIQVLRQNDVVPVIAVGNEGPGTSRSPGNYIESLSVGACDENGDVADFSSSQTFQRAQDPLVPDLMAPGVNIISAKPGGGFQMMDGTSMATPHVAGLAALLRQAKPAATVDQIEQAIFGSCAAVPASSSNRTARGVPNAPRALALLS